MAKECMGLLVPAICVLWETAEKTWQQIFALFVAVKHCGRLITKRNQFHTSKAPPTLFTLNVNQSKIYKIITL